MSSVSVFLKEHPVALHYSFYTTAICLCLHHFINSRRIYFLSTYIYISCCWASSCHLCYSSYNFFLSLLVNKCIFIYGCHGDLEHFDVAAKCLPRQRHVIKSITFNNDTTRVNQWHEAAELLPLQKWIHSVRLEVFFLCTPYLPKMAEIH